MNLSYSPLAKKVPGVRPPTDATLVQERYGACVHTTGRGVTSNARKKGITPLAEAIQTYINSQNGSNGYKWGGPGYVMDHSGSVYQLAADEVLTNHAGPGNTGTNKRYYDGTWIKKVAPIALAKWFAHWGPRYKHPYSLFPSKSPNHDYIGIEMIPCGDGFGEPWRPGLLFTEAQHHAMVDFLRDLGSRHQWPAGWWRGPRLVGHEDVDILNRMDPAGGWDPGTLREKPYFDFDYVRSNIT